jgi:diacylglycerol O-acyltransferase-1
MDSATSTSIQVPPAATRRDGRKETSDAQAADGTARPLYLRKYRHVAAVHSQTRSSTLSHDSHATPSFLGFRNLMVIVLVAGNLRLVIENLQKYGNLICFTCHDFRRQDVILGLGLYFLIPGFLFVDYLIELYAAQRARESRAQEIKRGGSSSPTHDQLATFEHTWRVIRAAHTINATIALLFTSWTVYYYIYHPLIGTITELHIIIVYMKMASYALTNRDLRHAYLHPVKGELAALPEIYARCPYPQNITMSNLCYFWWAPTLVYQPVYPRTDSIRWVFVAKRVVETICLSVFIWFCSAQYAAPVLWNSLDKMESLNLVGVIERLLKLSTISLVIWLAGFFALFQSSLNALAEVMRFGDRAFYDDWWNSAGLGDYWRLWNKPVYQFMKRHVYSPLVGRGYKMGHASIAVFFVSAILHELLVGVPTHNIIGVAFLGMLFQLPLIAITRPLQNIQGPTGRLIGNCIFWVSFTILGQPFAALLYFYAWQAKYGSVSKQMAVGAPRTSL